MGGKSYRFKGDEGYSSESDISEAGYDELEEEEMISRRIGAKEDKIELLRIKEEEARERQARKLKRKRKDF